MDISWIVTGLGVFLSIAGGLCAVIVPIVFVAAFGYFIYRRNQQSAAYRQAAQTWPSTSGTVLTSSVQSKRSGNGYSFYPVVVYNYQVNGTQYQSQRIKAGEQFMNVRVIGQSEATVARYPIGSTVTVYYNPANPSESALER